MIYRLSWVKCFGTVKFVSKHHHSEDRMQWNHLQSHVIHGWPNVVKVLLRTAQKFFLQALSAISSAFLQKRRNSEDLHLSNLNLLDGTILLEESSDLITHFLPTSSIQKKVHKQITSSSKLQFLLQKPESWSIKSQLVILPQTGNTSKASSSRSSAWSLRVSNSVAPLIQ